MQLRSFLISVPLWLASIAWSQEVNLYSARHYDTDQILYRNFTEKTGIKINLVEAGGEELLQRLIVEGRNSPADLLITVDIGRLWAAEQASLFQPVQSEVLESRIPSRFRHPDGLWFGLSKRMRLIFVAPDRVDPAEITRYEDLADPRFRGKIVVRSSSNVYNQSLLASLIARVGLAKAEDWAAGVVANMARPPQSNDTGQLRAVAAGQGDIAIANHYYFLRLEDSQKAEDRAVAAALTPIFPGQGEGGTGVHVNLSGVGLMKYAPNREAAIKFLEYLASDEAQRIYAGANYEFPVVEGLPNPDERMSALELIEEPVDAAMIGEHSAEALKAFDRVGWR